MNRTFRDDELIAVARQYVLESGNPDMIAYGGAFLRELSWYLPRLRSEAALVRSENDRVLDVGCGFGWHAVLLSLITGAEVVANDVRPTMTEVVDARCEALRRQGIPVRVTALLGDACVLDLPNASFDLITCLQTMEHVHDPEALLRVFFRVLAPGGRVLITNTNNLVNREVQRENERMWELRDTSQEFIEQIKRERPIENAGIEPYAVMRRRIIAEAAPGLDGAALDTLTSATAGQDRAQILRSVREYMDSGKAPQRPRHSWCRNPETGEYCERLIDPYELRAQLRENGFEARIEHRFNRWPLRWLNRVQFRPVNDMLFQLRPSFGILATKPPAGKPRIVRAVAPGREPAAVR